MRAFKFSHILAVASLRQRPAFRLEFGIWRVHPFLCFWRGSGQFETVPVAAVTAGSKYFDVESPLQFVTWMQIIWDLSRLHQSLLDINILLDHHESYYISYTITFSFEINYILLYLYSCYADTDIYNICIIYIYKLFYILY